jgi:hypothetical protein
MWTQYLKRRHAWLFATLLLSIGGHGFIAVLLSESRLRDLDLMEALLAVNLLAAIGGAATTGARFWLLISVAAASFATRPLQFALDVPMLLAVRETLWLVVFVFAAVGCARFALRRGTVDSERIFAALDAYLLAGIIFGVVYWACDAVWENSFAGELSLSRAIYFSFVTIATLGYGDIVPSSETSRGIAVLEAVGGQMYLAVLVARLVGLYARSDDGPDVPR